LAFSIILRSFLSERRVIFRLILEADPELIVRNAGNTKKAQMLAHVGVTKFDIISDQREPRRIDSYTRRTSTGSRLIRPMPNTDTSERRHVQIPRRARASSASAGPQRDRSVPARAGPIWTLGPLISIIITSLYVFGRVFTTASRAVDAYWWRRIYPDDAAEEGVR